VTISQFHLSQASQLLQGAYVNPNLTAVTQLMQTEYGRFQFAAVSLPINSMNDNYAYFAGFSFTAAYALQATVLVRAKLDFATSTLTFDPVNDVVELSHVDPNHLVQCYDTYTATYKPFIALMPPSYVIVSFPGRCSRFYRVDLPKANANFKDATVYNASVTDKLNNSKIVSTAFDPVGEIAYVALKVTDSAAVALQAVDTKNMLLMFSYPLAFDATDYDLVPTLAFGTDVDFLGKPKRYLFVAGYSYPQVYRIDTTVLGKSLVISGYATAGPKFDLVGSAVYAAPYFYFSTYEPNGKIVRIHKQSFCARPCVAHSYCDAGLCVCYAGWGPEIDPSNPTAIPKCVPSLVLLNEHTITVESGAVAGLAVFFVLAALVAILGWFLWFRARRTVYTRL